MKPIIGITAAGTLDMPGVGGTYCTYIERAGGIPVILPPCPDACETLVSRLDGILLSGGPDVAPSYFGGGAYDPHVVITAPKERDAFEIALAKIAYERSIPTLGICRGVQVMNVALGGTLHADLPGHRNIMHRISVCPGTRLHALIGAETAEVNSFHHQAVDRPAPGLVVTAHSDNGVIEAVEAANRRFYLGVQWHPERLDSASASASMINGLLEAIRK